ncbi:DedA family protein [Nocardioides gansuensis]|uniref:DedA family protein n=1 Tax=Nocardioides gansuensis TaxID=2138300 RepID=A0A2T8FE49_9ACTN|nr:DedA family protein [Nocardioides gansuensis]PVG83988.1 DedA family protein [Nocardioides gansuensis]
MSLVAALTGLPWWLVLGSVAALPALEASTMVGVVTPGETAVVAGGVAAHAGLVPLWAVILAAVGGAVVGDQVGYSVGRRYGAGLVQRLPRRARDSAGLDRALDLVRRHGALAVALGRWAATLRALVPGAAGMSGIGRRRFTVANLAGAMVWASAVAFAADLAGASYPMLEHRLGLVGLAVLVVALLVLGRYVARGRGPRPSTRVTDHGRAS